jgi:hypothetical protein
VTDTFTGLHNLISAPQGTDDFTTIIALGDYIDLPSLTIGGTTITDAEITGGADRGRLLRLIVVGINSFKSSGSYNENPSAPNHVVFQFQNIPVTHEMNAANTNAGGYKKSAMKTYLTGDFLTGLKNATGLTGTELWAPKRYVANGGGAETYATAADLIEDELWLPTEREMFGSRRYSHETYETASNQARLEYYATGTDGNTSRIKYNSSNNADFYWTASPYSSSSGSFCYVHRAGISTMYFANSSEGCAPAFCVR